jgi:hypothetical protein
MWHTFELFTVRGQKLFLAYSVFLHFRSIYLLLFIFYMKNTEYEHFRKLNNLYVHYTVLKQC